MAGNSRNVFHIEINEGTDYSVSFLYTDEITKLPVDLTGYSADLKVKQNNNGTYDGYANPNIVLELLTGFGITLTGVTGQVIVTVTRTQTTSQNWNRGVYELVLTTPTGTKIPFVNGFFTIISNPTT